MPPPRILGKKTVKNCFFHNYFLLVCIVVIIFAEAKTYVSNNYQIIWILSYSPQKIFRFFHKKFQLKAWESLRIFQLHFGFIFLQISFLLFLTYTLIGMACGHDSFTFIWLLPVRACSRYSKKNQLLWAVFRLVRRATTRHKNQIIYRENEKSWNLENEA